MFKEVSAVVCIFIFILGLCDAFATFRVVNGNYSTSGVGTCIKPFFKIKPLSRYATAESGGCTQLSRTLNKVLLRFSVEYKRNGNYRSLFGTDFFNACGRLKNKGNKLYEFFFEWIIPRELIQECPFKDDQFKMMNLTHPPIRYGPWPDGHYRISLSFKDDIDPNILSVTCIMKVTNTDNVVEF